MRAFISSSGSVIPILTVILTCVCCLAEPPSKVYIGMLMDDVDDMDSATLALNLAVDYVNNNSHILPSTTLKYKISISSQDSNSFDHIKNVCNQMSKKVDVVAVIGPTTSRDVKAVHPILEALHVPQIAVSATNPMLSLHASYYPYLFKMASPDTIESQVLVDLVRHFHWTRFALMVSSEYGPDGLIGEFHSIAVRSDWSIVTGEEFYPTAKLSEFNVTRQLLNIRMKGGRIIILHSRAPHTNLVLQQAAAQGMTGSGWAWIVTDLATSLPTLNPINGTVPTHLRGVIGTRTSVGLGQLADAFQRNWTQHGGQIPLPANSYHVFDSVLAIAYSLTECFRNETLWSPPKFSKQLCSQKQNETKAWPYGSLLREKLQKIRGPGSAYDLQFTDLRTPSIPRYDIINVKTNTSVKVGTWLYPGKKENTHIDNSLITFMGNNPDAPVDNDFDLQNIKLRITTILEEPFMMVHNNNATGNDNFYGYCRDLLDKLQESLLFEYELKLVPDGNYGSYDPNTDSWTGMVRQLKDRDVDLAVAPFTISYERQQKIDFTKPYLDLGLTVMLGIESKDDNLFRFAEPFSGDLWIAIFVSMVLCGVCVSLCSYLSPYGYYGRYIQRIDLEDESDAELHKLMSLPQAMWFAFASWTHQGAEYTPRCLSGRLIGGFWWLAVTVIIATYTANLAAFLTAARLNSGINSIDDLAAQTDIEYGTVAESQPQSFFEHSDSDPYRRLWSVMQSQETLVQDSVQGIERVRRGKYAFIWDSAVLDYSASKPPCNVRTVGHTFAKIGYGLGLQLDSPYTERFTLEILRLRQEGYIDELHKKYFTGDCEDRTASSLPGESTINFQSMAGVFYSLFGGFTVGLLVIIGEWCWAAYKESRGDLDKTFCRSFRRRASATKRDYIGSTCRICNPDYESDEEGVAKERQGNGNGQNNLDFDIVRQREDAPKTLQISITPSSRIYTLHSKHEVID
ncbi:glutamate receptor ionotropic, kainate 2-like [Ptychodera flava]|uniref:glutamate receptor ionotropic, kainate 2-like n=1 Tax=Ptychodera flava TaxID=63121 RepID=UPI00396A1FD7